MGCTGLYWSLLDLTGLHWDLIGWGGHWSGGSGGPLIQVIQVVQVVQVVRMISIDDAFRKYMVFMAKASNYQEKLRCHACDIRTHEHTEES